jgi:hypothetical protein
MLIYCFSIAYDLFYNGNRNIQFTVRQNNGRSFFIRMGDYVGIAGANEYSRLDDDIFKPLFIF